MAKYVSKPARELERLTTLKIAELEGTADEVNVRYQRLCVHLRADLDAMPDQMMNQLAGYDQELSEAKHQIVLLHQRLASMTQEAEKVVVD